MKKLSIIVAAGFITLSVTNGAHALCNNAPGQNGFAGIVNAEDESGVLKEIQVYANRQTNAGSGNDGENAGYSTCTYRPTEDSPDPNNEDDPGSMVQ